MMMMMMMMPRCLFDRLKLGRNRAANESGNWSQECRKQDSRRSVTVSLCNLCFLSPGDHESLYRMI